MTPDSDLPVGRPVPRINSFEVIESAGPTLTDEEKSWPVAALQARIDSFEVLEPPGSNGTDEGKTGSLAAVQQNPNAESGEIEEAPALELTLYLTDETLPDAVEMGKGLDALIRTVNAIDRAAGGEGYRIGGQLAERGKVGVTLLPVSHEGARSRIVGLVSRVTEFVTSAMLDIPGVTRITAEAA